MEVSFPFDNEEDARAVVERRLPIFIATAITSVQNLLPSGYRVSYTWICSLLSTTLLVRKLCTVKAMRSLEPVRVSIRQMCLNQIG